MGPVEFLHESTSTMTCAACGERGIMLRFKDKRAADRYARSLQGAKA